MTVEGIVEGGSGSLKNSISTVVTSGVLSGAMEWLTKGPMSIRAVNLDLFNSEGSLIASDLFQGVIAGQAFSTFSVSGLLSGTYSLVLTGIASEGARYHIDLSASATVPRFTRIPTAVAVPLPHALPLFVAGLLALGVARQVRARRTA